VPTAVLETISEDPPPGAIQAVANLLDSVGAMKRFDEPARPREIIAAARRRNIGIMGIRAVQAGALTDAFDRKLPETHPEMLDYRRAARFRELAREIGESPATLAHRYSLSIPGVATVILGVKNRSELRECVAAAERGPLESELIRRIDAAVGRAD
jgi:aryl-alcohol dehydrogenase-like predicted oxidoreductase